MKDYVLDANALVRLFRNQDGAAKIQALLIQSDRKLASLRISAVNLGEVLYIFARFSTIEDARKAVRKIQSLVQFVPVDPEQALAAAELKYRYKLGLADCFAAELCIRTGATLVTADPDFERLGKQLKILALPRHVQ